MGDPIHSRLFHIVSSLSSSYSLKAGLFPVSWKVVGVELIAAGVGGRGGTVTVISLRLEVIYVTSQTLFVRTIHLLPLPNVRKLGSAI